MARVNNERAYKRVGQWGEGWVPSVVDPQEQADGKDRQACQGGWRNPDNLDMPPFVPTGMFRTRSELAELAKAGADNTVIWLQGEGEKE